MFIRLQFLQKSLIRPWIFLLLISTIQAWTEIQNKAVGHFALAVLATFLEVIFGLSIWNRQLAMPLSSSIYFHNGNLSSPRFNWRAGSSGVVWGWAGAPASYTLETLSTAEISCSDTQGFLQSKPLHQVFSKIKRAESKLHLPIFFHIDHEKALPVECTADQNQYCTSVKGRPTYQQSNTVTTAVWECSQSTSLFSSINFKPQHVLFYK